MKTETRNAVLKSLVIVFGLVIIGLAIYLPLKLTGTLNKITSAEELRNIINSSGLYSYLLFFVIQFLQTTFLPIPAIATTLVGTWLFGPWITFAISLVAVVLASLFIFFLGRKIGTKLAIWTFGEKTTQKWQSKLEKGKFVFFLMMLFPIFPDDILCLVVGATTSMTYRFFITTNLITRPISIFSTCFFGSGMIIPFAGWGIPVWIVLGCLMIISFYLSIKFEPQIENFINNFSKKLSKKQKNKETDAKEINL